MKQNELRIGNYVEYENPHSDRVVVQVKARPEDDIFDDVNDFYMVFKTITEKVGDSEEKMQKMLEIIKGAEL